MICKLRISEHKLLIETGRYSKGRILPRDERIRICCISILLMLKSDVFVLVSIHRMFMSNSPTGGNKEYLYNNERVKLFEMVRNFNCNFILLNDIDKAIWLLLQLLALSFFIHSCFKIRNKAT